jgi:uncharacterized protein (TIGR02677 family)
VDDRIFRNIKEAAYLCTDKTHRYRPILRFMYERHRANRSLCYPNEILEHLKEHPSFQDYTLEELNRDLAILGESNNLESMQDKGKVDSYEEYIRRRYRYKCTPYTIELESTIIGMEETLHAIRGSLDRKLPDNLALELKKFEEILQEMPYQRSVLSKINNLWDEVHIRFEKLVKDASDFLSHINGEDLEQLMRGEEFLAFKTSFVDYLQNFISALRPNKEFIRVVLRKIQDNHIEGLLEALVEYQKLIPRLDMNDMPTDEKMKENFLRKWNALYLWFHGPFGESDVDYLEKQTIEMIRLITKMAQQASERQRFVKNRKSDYKHLAQIIHNEGDIDKANELFVILFGFEKWRNFHVSERKDNTDKESVWDFPTSKHELKKKKSPSRKKRSYVPKYTLEKKILQQEYQERQRQEQEWTLELIKQKTLVFEQMDYVSPFQRKCILSWIGKAMLSKKKDRKNQEFIATTETGHTFILKKRSNKMIELPSSDGTLRMPDYVMEFQEV